MKKKFKQDLSFSRHLDQRSSYRTLPIDIGHVSPRNRYRNTFKMYHSRYRSIPNHIEHIGGFLVRKRKSVDTKNNETNNPPRSLQVGTSSTVYPLLLLLLLEFFCFISHFSSMLYFYLLLFTTLLCFVLCVSLNLSAFPRN